VPPPDEPRSTQEFEALIEYLKNSRGFDFSGYKRSSLRRRMGKRMQALRIERYSDYLDYLEVHPEEFSSLFNTILINVTSFFRDMASWEFLATEVIPPLIAGKHPHESIRVWSAGCASGEEAYTLAMVLAEALGLERFQQRVKIYATDVDEEALAQARHARYSARDLQSVSAELCAKYFEEVSSRFVFRPDLRRAVIFGRHDIVQDAPISHLDLLVCRNTLMYFNAETQSRILARFHFALNDTGVIFLGKAEMLLTRANLFTPIHLKHRIFTLDIHLVPLVDTDGTSLGISITFHDVTHHRRLQTELEKSRQDLETAYEELQSTNEELETTNEELQSTVEELETTNEELQSSNEELETMNEELQSGNEELQTTNDELRERTDEVNRSKAFLESILASLHAAAVVLDPSFNVLWWNAEASELWGLREDEVQGQSILNLDIGLPVEQLRPPVRAVLSGRSTFQEVMLSATNRRGKVIQCRVTCTPLADAERDTQGVILLMEEWSGHA
jgi:two-component system, chemotaxis family, CheB/CheR fusion protein